ncbi:hypothetical protein J2T57_003432 [Natronocella acetinitrilica]|uniref:Outer membrane protein assembly factor BamE n=1 Tax=Natronocella acetinitrilica TaxID=414046 RepID=A0AAE3G898_9GAMM|nr:hypothetical protein [Natronocella acetinitrilica]MCP1676273.1 hypothetical protein [Natronocella acetinitrilica]
MPVRAAKIGVLALGLALFAPIASADRLLIDNVRQADQIRSERPQNGETMDQVARRYGDPGDRVEAVGEPPISRWIYDGFTVYFEHDRVLHSVERHD